MSVIACNWVTDCTEPHSCVFEPGCGSGVNLLWLAQKKGFSNLIGSDISPEAVSLSHILTEKSDLNINISLDDSLHPKCLPNNVSTILSVNWLYHVQGSYLSGFLATYRSCLKRNGRIVCDMIDASYNKYQNNKYHTDDINLPPSKRRSTEYLFRYSRQEVEAIAADNGFKVLRHTSINGVIPRIVYMLESV